MSESDTRKLLEGAAELFNRKHYFECHDHLEEAWSGERGKLKEFLQGLIHLSVGMYHLAASNAQGAVHLLDRAVARLEAFPEDAYGVDLPPLVARASLCLSKARRLAEGETIEWAESDIPRIELLKADCGEGGSPR